VRSAGGVAPEISAGPVNNCAAPAYQLICEQQDSLEAELAAAEVEEVLK
jgi:hypothetical protein